MTSPFDPQAPGAQPPQPTPGPEPAADETPAPGAWRPPTEGGEPTAPPASAPDDPAAPAQQQHPKETISESSFDVVGADGSTERTSPGYSAVPCPVCLNTSVKTANVQASLPVATLRGDSVSPGDQIVLCESCGATIAAGDAAAFEQEAAGGAYGEQVKAVAAAATAQPQEEVTEDGLTETEGRGAAEPA